MRGTPGVDRVARDRDLQPSTFQLRHQRVPDEIRIGPLVHIADIGIVAEISLDLRHDSLGPASIEGHWKVLLQLALEQRVLAGLNLGHARLKVLEEIEDPHQAIVARHAPAQAAEQVLGEQTILGAGQHVRELVRPRRGKDDPTPPGLEPLVIVVRQSWRQRCGNKVPGLADSARMAAIEDDHDLAGLNPLQRRGELVAGDRCPGQFLVLGIDGVDWQKILAAVGARLDPTAVAREVNQGGRIRVTSSFQRAQAISDGGLGCIAVEQGQHILRPVSAVSRVDQQVGDLTCILHLRQLTNVLVVGDADDQSVCLVHQTHGMSLNSEM